MSLSPAILLPQKTGDYHQIRAIRSGTDPSAVDAPTIYVSFDGSGHPGIDRRHLRWLHVIAGHAAKTAHLYSIVVPELEEAT